MSNARTGYLTPPNRRRYSTGRRDVDTTINLDNVSLSRKQERKPRSELSIIKAEPSEASYGHGKHDRENMKNEPTLHHAKAKNGTLGNAFEAHESGSRDLDMSYAGSWCEME